MKKKIFASLATVTLLCSSGVFGALVHADSSNIPQASSVGLNQKDNLKAFDESVTGVLNGVVVGDTVVTGHVSEANINLAIQIEPDDGGAIEEYFGKSDSYGNFSITLSQPAVLHDSVVLYQITDGGEYSYLDGKGVFESSLETGVLNPVHEGDTVVKGYVSKPGLDIQIIVSNLGEGGDYFENIKTKADANGNFIVNLSNPAPLGARVKLSQLFEGDWNTEMDSSTVLP